MTDILFVLPFVLFLFILISPSKLHYYFAFLLTVYFSVITSIPAVSVLFNYTTTPFVISILSAEIIIDKLSAFFILVTNFTMLTGMLYSKGYLQPYLEKKKSLELALHYINYVLLHVSMLMVLMFRSGFAFLVVWELMAISSFFLILFEGEKRTTLKTAVNYLIQMHVGFMFLLIALLISSNATGILGFDGLKIYFASNNNVGLFLLFFIGFGMKAGFVPLHTWLPDAHPAAPSHVSGTMSGVMIKMGIYGILRVLTYVQDDLFLIGIIILAISAISGLLGVMLAIIQHDLKKLLAYHSIENIGIIGMGLGLGTIGLSLQNDILVILGFSGTLLHVLNHSLFKSLLFFSTGSVYKNYHTLNIEQLGGVIHRMPKTALFFLIGSAAICGLPPLNGFISEMLIYVGLFNGLIAGTFYHSIVMLLAIVCLASIGGLAIFCFTKVFGIVFLGSERKKPEHEISEVDNNMLFPQLLITFAILLIGLFPILFIQPISLVVSDIFHIQVDNIIFTFSDTFRQISIICMILIGVTGLLFFLRSVLLKKRNVGYSPTWGCGYANTSAKQQYTSTSFANSFYKIAHPVLITETDYFSIHEEEIIPQKHSFKSHSVDVFKKITIKIIDFIAIILKNLARLQTGLIQHYILYAFIFILFIFALLFLSLL